MANKTDPQPAKQTAPASPASRLLGWFAPALGLAVVLVFAYLQHVKPLIEAPDPDDPQQVSMGGRVYEKNCASCHGADLGGRAAKPGLAPVPSIAAGSKASVLDPAEALAPFATAAPQGPHASIDVALAQRRYLQAFLADRWRTGASR
ncbi:MAG: c-type cytochrome [Alphaproteobacteria bacterium]